MSKVAIYGICKNEINFIERCLEPVKNADYIVILDTGSTDGTYERLVELQKEIPQLLVFQEEIKPFRFDTARNKSMSLVPADADILVSIDLDDIFHEGWKEAIEEDFAKGYNKVYGYWLQYNADGSYKEKNYLDRASKRNAHWVHAIHENLVYDDEEPNICYDDRFVSEHRQDLTKNRSNYIDLTRADLNINDPYTYLIYAYELFNNNQQEEALEYFSILYNLHSEYSTRRWIVMCARWLAQQGRKQEALDWYHRAEAVNNPKSTFDDYDLYHGKLEEEIKLLTHDYKIAVYAICGNEIHNIEDWMSSMWEANYICVLDTGSTDGSYEKLKEYQTKYPNKVIINRKTYSPWRFDTPRNDSMKLVPADADICICTDLDERLTPTWGDKVRAVWTPKCERGYYLYAWSHLGNGEPARVFWYDKIHANRGEWQWRYPVHEALFHPIYGDANLGEGQFCRLPSDFIMLHHYPTYKEGRSNYLPLLEQRAKENPEEFYGLIYLAHEYKYQKQYEKCINFIYKNIFPLILEKGDHMNCMPDLYMFLGDCFWELGKEVEAESNYRAGIAADPMFRDNYIRLSRLLYTQKKTEDALEIMNNCFKYSNRQYSWLETDAAWSWEPWDLLCLIYWDLHATYMSYVCAKMAFTEDPTNDRLRANFEQLSKIVAAH